MYELPKSAKYNKTFTKQKRSRINFFFGKKDMPQNSKTARKIAAGVNQSEVYFTEELTKKPSIFDKIFNFFD